jgi:hypothetical protein
VLNQHPTLGNRTVFGFLLLCELPPAWLFVWLCDLDARKCETDKAEIL